MPAAGEAAAAPGDSSDRAVPGAGRGRGCARPHLQPPAASARTGCRRLLVLTAEGRRVSLVSGISHRPRRVLRAFGPWDTAAFWKW